MPGPIRTLLPKPSRMRRPRLGRPATWWTPVAIRQDEAFRNIWQELRQHGTVVGNSQMALPTDRADDADRIVCAIRIPTSSELDAALAPVRRTLNQFPFVRLYPNEAMHIVIQELGILVQTPGQTRETSLELIEEFKQGAELPISDFPAFDIVVGGFNSFLDAPFLDVHDDGWCSRIHHRLRDFLLAPIDDSFAYLPHIMLGAYTQTSDMGRFPAMLAPWRDQRFGSFTARSVDLLRIPADDPLSVPEVLHSFELGHQRSAAEAVSRGDIKDVIGQA